MINRKHFTAACACLLLFLSFSCKNTTPSLSAAEKKTVSDSVRNTLLRYNEAVKRTGLTAEFDYLDSSDDFYWVPPGFNGPISYDSVAILLRQNAQAFISIDNSWLRLDIRPLTNELASYTGKIKSIMKEKQGKESTTYLLETGIVIKRKNGWKLLSGQTMVVDE
jgi:hypothetical protein